MQMQLHLSDYSMSEEEPSTLEVEEFPQEKLPEDKTISTEETLHQVESAPYQHNITSSYLKSFSNESSSSDATQASRSTEITVEYSSTHEVLSGGVEYDDDDDEENDAFGFFSCPKSPFLEPLISIGGKLTLDSVKIDCSDFLDCAWTSATCRVSVLMNVIKIVTMHRAILTIFALKQTVLSKQLTLTPDQYVHVNY